jgi:hypothetical protein
MPRLPTVFGGIDRRRARALLDAPCGDFNWIAEGARQLER